MESAPQRRLKFREIMRRPLCRHEARMAISPVAMAVLYVLAGLIDLAGLWALSSLEMLDYGAWLNEGAPLIAAWFASGATVAVAILLVPALMAPAVAGEKERGTLDALVLTPVDRYELVWAKLLGRTQPVRRFLLAAAPGFSAGVMVVVMFLARFLTYGSVDIAASGMEAVLWPVLYGAFWTAGFWAFLVSQVFGLAGTMLWISARARRTLTAGVISYAVLLVYAVAMIGFFLLGPITVDALLLVYVIPPVAVLVFLLLGPITINRLVNDFDKLAVPD